MSTFLFSRIEMTFQNLISRGTRFWTETLFIKNSPDFTNTFRYKNEKYHNYTCETYP